MHSFTRRKREAICSYFAETEHETIEPDSLVREISLREFPVAAKCINAWSPEKRAVLKKYLPDLANKQPDQFELAAIASIVD